MPGGGVAVGAEAHVEGSVVLDGAVISERCLVEQSIVGKNPTLGPGVHVADCSVLGDNIRAGGENEFRRGVRVWPSVVIEEETIRF